MVPIVNHSFFHPREYHELEAKFIQLESKHLVLLREAQEPEQGLYY